MGKLVGLDTDSFQSIMEIAQRFLPSEVQDIVTNTFVTLSKNSTSTGIMGFGLLLYSASTVFGVLNQAVDRIWNTTSEATPNQRPLLIKSMKCC